MSNSLLDKINCHDRRFILGFDAAVETFKNSIDNLESEEIVTSVRCFKNAADDVKSFIKEYLLDDFESIRNSIIAEMIVGHGENNVNNEH